MYRTMTQEDYNLVDDPSEIEFINGSLHVTVLVDLYEEDYKGSSRGEEYSERKDAGRDVREFELPLSHVNKKSNYNEEYTGSEALDFIQNNTWDSQEVVDVETMEFEKDGEVWVASFDSGKIDEYRY